jgi:predicted nuclease of predicted toxin-antitoxin system
LHHTAIHIQDIKLGLSDFEIIDLSVVEGSIIITFDKDFGEMIFKDKKVHSGIILLRLKDQTFRNTIKVLKIVLKRKNLENNFTVVSEKQGLINMRTISTFH